MEYTTKSDQETQQVAEDLAKKLSSRIFALSGQLGSGKTTFVQGFAKGLGIREKIISPSFVLIRQHKIPKTNKTLQHIDLYRLDDKTSLTSVGLEEIINNPENIVLIEWAEKAKEFLPEDTLWIYFETIDQNTRKIIIKKLNI